MHQTARARLVAYGVAVLAVAVSLLVRWPLWPVLGDAVPHMTFFPAVMIAAYFGGFWPGLLATLVACAEQEHQRAAGAWHAEWEPLTALLRLTGSAASWAAELMSGLVVDASRMAANLAATKDLPLAEHVTSLLAGVLGGAQAHDLVAEAGQRAVSAGLPLRDVLLAVPKLEGRLASAGITAEQIESALEPAGYLGAADAFVTAALRAHAADQGEDHG